MTKLKNLGKNIEKIKKKYPEITQWGKIIDDMEKEVKKIKKLDKQKPKRKIKSKNKLWSKIKVEPKAIRTRCKNCNHKLQDVKCINSHCKLVRSK